jgi:hypothetical protein
MRRIVVLLSVVAMMVGMLAMSVLPAFAAPGSPCSGNGNIVQSTSPYFDPAYDSNNNGLICKYDRYDKSFNLISTRFKDDRIV